MHRHTNGVAVAEGDTPRAANQRSLTLDMEHVHLSACGPRIVSIPRRLFTYRLLQLTPCEIHQGVSLAGSLQFYSELGWALCTVILVGIGMQLRF